MRFGIISDTHNKYADILLAVNIFKEKDCALVLHAGDFNSPTAFQMFQDNSFGLLYAKGNHDSQIPAQSEEKENALSILKIFILHNTYTRNNRQILLNALVDSGEYDLIIYGHLHYLDFRQPDSENHTVAINPGGFYYPDMSTFCIYDTEQHQLEVFFKFNGSFVLTLIFEVSGTSFSPTICSHDAAYAFFIAYMKHKRNYIHSGKDTREQWLSTAI